MATATRSFDRLCETHRYPLRADGACPRCEAEQERNVVAPSCPHYKSWDREFRTWLLDEFLLAKSQGGDDDDRRQRSWEQMLAVVAHRRGVLLRWSEPKSALLERLTGYHARLVNAAKD